MQTTPSYTIQCLVSSLLDVFDATRDLYQTLTIKEKRDYEQSLRSRGYPATRRIEYVRDEALGSDEAIVMDKAAVTRQFEIGKEAVGSDFTNGDSKSLYTSNATLQVLSVCSKDLWRLAVSTNEPALEK